MVNSPGLPNAAATRWISYIQLFGLEYKHISTELHKASDRLSRRLHAAEDSDNPDLEEDCDQHGPFIKNGQLNSIITPSGSGHTTNTYRCCISSIVTWTMIKVVKNNLKIVTHLSQFCQNIWNIQTYNYTPTMYLIRTSLTIGIALPAISKCFRYPKVSKIRNPLSRQYGNTSSMIVHSGDEQRRFQEDLFWIRTNRMKQ